MWRVMLDAQSQRDSPLAGKPPLGAGARSRAAGVLSQPQLLEAVLHFLEMEVQRAESLQLTLLKVLCHLGVGLELGEEIGVFAAGMLGLPGPHRVALDQVV